MKNRKINKNESQLLNSHGEDGARNAFVTVSSTAGESFTNQWIGDWNHIRVASDIEAQMLINLQKCSKLQQSDAVQRMWTALIGKTVHDLVTITHDINRILGTTKLVKHDGDSLVTVGHLNHSLILESLIEIERHSVQCQIRPTRKVFAFGASIACFAHMCLVDTMTIGIIVNIGLANGFHCGVLNGRHRESLMIG